MTEVRCAPPGGCETLDEMVEATGWLPHTTRAALTGLRHKAFDITKVPHAIGQRATDAERREQSARRSVRLQHQPASIDEQDGSGMVSKQCLYRREPLLKLFGMGQYHLLR